MEVKINEWNYQKQLLSIQVQMNSRDAGELTKSLFSDDYLLERPLLKAIRNLPRGYHIFRKNAMRFWWNSARRWGTIKTAFYALPPFP